MTKTNEIQTIGSYSEEIGCTFGSFSFFLLNPRIDEVAASIRTSYCY